MMAVLLDGRNGNHDGEAAVEIPHHRPSHVGQEHGAMLQLIARL
jgi:hypothetical protein